MGKQHETIPNQPSETPLEWGNPEVLEPQDPGTPTMPEEKPDTGSQELPEETDENMESKIA